MWGEGSGLRWREEVGTEVRSRKERGGSGGERDDFWHNRGLVRLVGVWITR